MGKNIRIEGIYDQRTLKHLKQNGLKDFCFEFSPRSFNFIQEYVFLEQLLPLFSSTDRLFLHFSRSNDPMVSKLILDLKKSGQDLGNIYFEFDEWSDSSMPINFEHKYLLNFSNDIDLSKMIGPNFNGFVFNFDFFENLHHKNLLTNFSSNFFTRFHSKLKADNLMLLRADWNSNLISTLFDLFDFDLLSLPINSKIEVCYRNVDLNKLTSEMEVLQKNSFLSQDF